MANPQFAVLSLTEAAAARARSLIEAAGRPVAGLRVGIKKGGCAGMTYTMDLADEVRPADEVIEDQGVKILIAPKDLMFLLGTRLDFEVDKLQASFTFQNPNQTGACGCGESVSITPADDAPGNGSLRLNFDRKSDK
jgi:iron-sulfur cluster assembly protein